MPNKTFLDFQQKTELASGDYIVGYKADGTAEFRAALSDLAQYVFDYTVPTYSLEAGSASADEGTSVTFTLSTAFVRNGTVIPYTITGIDAADLESGTLTGNFVVNNNTASQVIALSADQFTEGTETLILTLNGITPTVSATVNISDTSITPGSPTYNLYFRSGSGNAVTSISENNNGYGFFQLILETTNVPEDTLIPFTVSGVTENDFVSEVNGQPFALYGNTIIANFAGNGEGSYDMALVEDLLTEGPETMVVTLDGITPTVSAALVINDTSTTITPTYELRFSHSGEPNVTEAPEGTTVVVQLITTDVPEGTIIPFTITGVAEEDYLIVPVTVPPKSTFEIDSNGNASFEFETVPDYLTEGPETMVVTLDGITPTVSAALVINDTSTTIVPTYDLQFESGGVLITEANEGDDAVYVRVNTTNLPPEAIIPYTITGISSEDIDVPLMGALPFNGGWGAGYQFGLSFNISNDFLTEGPETMVVTLDGITPTVSAALVINDTSTTP